MSRVCAPWWRLAGRSLRQASSSTWVSASCFASQASFAASRIRWMVSAAPSCSGFWLGVAGGLLCGIGMGIAGFLSDTAVAKPA